MQLYDESADVASKVYEKGPKKFSKSIERCLYLNIYNNGETRLFY